MVPLGRCCGYERQLLFTLDSFALSASHRLSKGRKTQPLLEQNVLVETTDLHNFKHLLIRAMPRKQGTFFLISIETLGHASFLTYCKHVSMHQQALPAGPAFFLDNTMSEICREDLKK